MSDPKALAARYAEDLKRLARGIRREHQGGDWHQAAKVADDAANALEAAQAENERLREALAVTRAWVAALPSFKGKTETLRQIDLSEFRYRALAGEQGDKP